MSENSNSTTVGSAGMAVAYGVGMVPPAVPFPSPTPGPFEPHPIGCRCATCAPFFQPITIVSYPSPPTLPPGLAEAAEAVRLALKEQQEAERAHAEASIAVETAKAKHRAAVEHLVKVAGGAAP